MKKSRSIWVALRLTFVASILAISASTTSASPQECPYFYFACPNEQYDCCCLKGVRCDLSATDCERWCRGELD